MAAGEGNIITARQLIKRHKNPEDAFLAADPTKSGSVSANGARTVLQNLTGVTLTPVEVVALSKKYGDGKNLNYRKFLEDQQLPTSARTEGSGAAAPSTLGRAATPSKGSVRKERVEAEVGRSVGTYLSQPGIDKAKDVSVLESAESRLLKFSSDSLDTVPLVDGRSPAPVVAQQSNRGGARARTPINRERRNRDYSEQHAAVVGSSVPSIQAAEASHLDGRRNFSKVDGEGGAETAMHDPMYHGGHIAGSGTLSSYMYDVTAANEAPGPEYLPVFPGEDWPRLRPRDTAVFHSGPVAGKGGVGNYVSDETWRTEAPAGYLLPLPNAHDPEMPRMAPYDPMHTNGRIIEAGGVGGWNNDVERFAAAADAHRAAHPDPQHHGGVFSETGGLPGFAGDSTTWLQRVPIGAKQHMVSPHLKRASSAHKEKGSGKAHGQTRRRSVPDLIVNAPGTPKTDASYDQELDELFSGAGGSPQLASFVAGNGEVDDEHTQDFAATGKPITGVRRNPEASQLSHLGGLVPGTGVDRREELGPITDNLGMHHKANSYGFGAKSPMAAALAASPMVKFDAHRLAVVRKAMREALPEKASAAAVMLSSRLKNLDGDGDGKVTDSEMMTGLGSVFPDLDAASVGMLVRYFKHKKLVAKRAAAAAAVSSRAEDGEPSGQTAGQSGSDRGSRDSNGDSAASIPVLDQAPLDRTQLPRSREVRPIDDRKPAPGTGVEEVHASTTSTAAFGEGIDVAEVAEWILKQPGGVGQILSPLQAAGPANNIIAMAGLPRQTEPLAPADSHKRGSPPKGTLLSTDSGAVAAALYDPTTPRQHGSGLPDDLRFPGQAPVAYADVANDDAASMFTSFTLSSGTASGRAKTSSYGDMHRKKVTHALSGEQRRGDTAVPAAGMSFTNKRGKDTGDEDEDGSPVDRTEWATRNAKFESFRVKWEAKHGAAAVKEMQLDAAEPVDGPTWARANPAPFKVLHLSQGPGTP